jgi:hypothetical protein
MRRLWWHQWFKRRVASDAEALQMLLTRACRGETALEVRRRLQRDRDALADAVQGTPRSTEGDIAPDGNSSCSASPRAAGRCGGWPCRRDSIGRARTLNALQADPWESSKHPGKDAIGTRGVATHGTMRRGNDHMVMSPLAVAEPISRRVLIFLTAVERSAML